MRVNKLFKKIGVFVLILSWLLFGWPATNNVKAVTNTYTTSGSWQAPAGVTSVTVELWGAGGGGGGGGGNGQGGGGGAGGQYVKKVATVTPGNTYNYTVGTGGTGGTSANGTAGNDTTFDSTTAVAKGGAFGYSWANGYGGGQGSTTGGVGDVSFIFAGGNGAGGGTGSGGGGGGAGSSGTGNSASTQTGGLAKTEYGGAGGNGTTTTNAIGSPGSVYGGGGGGSTKSSKAGNGANGFVRLTYNSNPSFTVTPADSPDPVTTGNDVTFTATATDSENNWYLAVCKTNSITAGSPPTCATDQTYCVSSSTAGSGAQNSCVWTSSGTGAMNWYAFACDNATVNPLCSSVNTTNSPITVNAALIYSVSITTADPISYGSISGGGGNSKSTIDLSATKTVQNDGNTTEKLTIKTTNATGGTQWTVGASPAENVYVHEFSINTGGWTKFTTADTYQTMIASIGVGITAALDLQVTTPTSSDAVEKSITVTIMAEAI